MLEKLKRLAKRVWRFRSSVTGRYVTKAYAKAHPKETEREKA